MAKTTLKPKRKTKTTSRPEVKRGTATIKKKQQKQTMKTVKAVEVPAHVLLRVRSEDGKTIKEHGNMVASKGAAILGKIGQGLGPSFITALNKQIENGVDTYLFLTIREGWNGPYVTYQCNLRSVDSELKKSKQSFVPKYYASEYENVSTWFEIVSMSKMSREEMNRIYVLSSDREIMSVIKSTAVVFRVGLRKPRK